MTSIINNSNANSALINTINASQSKMNPNVYSTKKIYPSSAVTYVKTQKSSGSVGPNQTMVFDLMKYGIAQQILLCYTKKGNAATTIGAFDFLDVIDRVELLSSSKVIDTLTNADLACMWSDLDTSQFNIVNKSAIAARAANAHGGTGVGVHQFVVPLRWGLLSDINTQLNLQFNEPMSIRIRFGANPYQHSDGGAAANAPTIADDDVFLKMRYKAYNEADFSEILAENYNEPELNQMSVGFYDESVVTKAFAPTAVASTALRMDLDQPGVKVELKNTDCVNNFFVMVREVGVPAGGAGAGEAGNGGNFVPREILRLRMSASGQEIFDLQGEELFYSKLCMNGYSTLSNTGTSLENISKIQTGLWEYADGGTQSNTLSLRELNNPIIEVWFVYATNATGNGDRTYAVSVVEDAVKIYSTTSATGRLQVALTN